jgi:hypothetical protein
VVFAPPDPKPDIKPPENPCPWICELSGLGVDVGLGAENWKEYVDGRSWKLLTPPAHGRVGNEPNPDGA